MATAKIVFLYTEIAGYFLACASELSKHAEVLIVRWPVNKEAPFEFNAEQSVKILDRHALSEADLKRVIHEFKPSILVCSGWIDKGYVEIAKSFKKKIPVVLTLDNHWAGNFRQRLASLISPFYLKRIFTHAWVPGEPQSKFARKLGFGNRILLQFYCADTTLFSGIFAKTFESKKIKFPHRFLYVARYVEHKGIFELWDAFEKLKKHHSTDWELWCIGTGDQWENRKLHPAINHIGFVQPQDLEKYIAQTGVYILPSKFEPWGVTLQEFSVCGMPVLASNAVGSSTRFLQGNGFKFESGSADAIYETMLRLISLSDKELLEMGLKSHEIGMSLTPEIWSKNLLSLLD